MAHDLELGRGEALPAAGRSLALAARTTRPGKRCAHLELASFLQRPRERLGTESLAQRVLMRGNPLRPSPGRGQLVSGSRRGCRTEQARSLLVAVEAERCSCQQLERIGHQRHQAALEDRLERIVHVGIGLAEALAGQAGGRERQMGEAERPGAVDPRCHLNRLRGRARSRLGFSSHVVNLGQGRERDAEHGPTVEPARDQRLQAPERRLILAIRDLGCCQRVGERRDSHPRALPDRTLARSA